MQERTKGCARREEGGPMCVLLGGWLFPLTSMFSIKSRLAPTRPTCAYDMAFAVDSWTLPACSDLTFTSSSPKVYVILTTSSAICCVYPATCTAPTAGKNIREEKSKKCEHVVVVVVVVVFGVVNGAVE